MVHDTPIIGVQFSINRIIDKTDRIPVTGNNLGSRLGEIQCFLRFHGPPTRAGQNIIFWGKYFLGYRKNIFEKIIFSQLTKRYFLKKYIFSKNIFSKTENIIFFRKYFLVYWEYISEKKVFFQFLRRYFFKYFIFSISEKIFFQIFYFLSSDALLKEISCKNINPKTWKLS